MSLTNTQGSPIQMPLLDDRAQYSMLVRDLAAALRSHFWDPVEQTTRRALAGVPLLPPPQWSVTLVAAGADASYDIDLPDSLCAITFTALAATGFSVAFGGRIVQPRVQTANLSGSFLPNDPVFAPLNQIFYCKGIKKISVGIAAAAAIVSVIGWQQV